MMSGNGKMRFYFFNVRGEYQLMEKEAIAVVKTRYAYPVCRKYGGWGYRVHGTFWGSPIKGSLGSTRSQAWKAAAKALDPPSASTPLSSFDLDKLPF